MEQNMQSAFDQLPIGVFLNILKFLDYKDILTCSQVCCNWYKYSMVESIWKPLCIKYWAAECCPEDLTWRELFLSKCKGFSKYQDVYARIATAWKQIDSYLSVHYQDLRESLFGGWEEKDLLKFELENNLEIPLDLKCAYRFHGGQNYEPDQLDLHISGEWPNPGLFGSVQNYDYFRTNIFLPPAAHPDLPSEVMILTDCPYSNVKQYIALKDFNNLKKGQIFSMVGFQNLNKKIGDFFIHANSFLDYFTDYAAKLSSGYFPSERGHIYRFYKEPTSEAISHNVKIQVATAFLPEMSSLTSPKFTHAYRVTMSMDKNADGIHACRLVIRHWKIVDSEGHEESVDGPGVIGLYPIMEPGANFSYISCTNFNTKSGRMYGTFECDKLRPPRTRIHLKIPEFNMMALPFVKNME